MTVLLLGDSHLDRVRWPPFDRFRDLVGTQVDNRALGGSVALDLSGQAHGLELSSYDAAVVSVGTNDASPWGDVALPAFRAAVAQLVAGAPARWVAVTTPGVDGARTPDGGRGNAVMTAYADALAEVVAGADGVVVRSREVIAPLGSDGFVDDGVHLSRAAYDLLLPAIAAAVRSLRD